LKSASFNQRRIEKPLTRAEIRSKLKKIADLVYAVVGEMHEDISHTATVVCVLVGGEAHQAIVVEVDSQGIDAGQEHVQAEVKLGPVNQVGPSNVSKE